MRRTRWMLATLAALALGAAACSADPAEPSHPVEVADDVLGEFVIDARMIAGIEISDARVVAYAGHPVEKHTLYPDSDGDPIEDPAQALAVRGSEFPLEEALDLARLGVDDCDEFSYIRINPLSPGVITAEVRCEDQTTRTFLGDGELVAIVDPIGADTIHAIWEEFGTAGVGSAVRYLEIDAADAGWVQIAFDGPAPLRTYSWYRGLDGTASRVSSTDALDAPPVDLQDFPADVVAGALEAMLEGLDDPSMARRFEFAPGEDGVRLVLEDAEYNLLAEEFLTQ